MVQIDVPVYADLLAMVQELKADVHVFYQPINTPLGITHFALIAFPAKRDLMFHYRNETAAPTTLATDFPHAVAVELLPFFYTSFSGTVL